MTAIYNDLKDKVVLVTGAMRGIGNAISKSLAEQGCHVVFNHRGDMDKAMSFKHELEAIGGKATPLLFDVTNSAQIKEAIDTFVKEIGPISGLINNAGISKDQLAMRLKDEDVSRILDTNLKGAMMVTSSLSRSFLKAENVSVVTISSIVGLMGNPSQMAYAASKAGLIGMTKSYAKELASRNIRANVICPGFIETEMTKALTEQAKESYLSGIPLKRFGATSEVASLVSFLLSCSSSYITGETIKIDGGLYI